MRVISICGVDGTGKTTLLSSLGDFPTLRSPQYFESGPGFACAQASRALEDLGNHADRVGDVKTKAVALFLAMTLAGSAESELLESDLGRKTQTLIRERDPIVDSVVYSGFYLKLLSTGWSAEHVPERYLPVLSERCEHLGCNLESLGKYMVEIFSKPPVELAGKLYQIYGCRASTDILLLVGSEITIRERMRLKNQDKSGVTEAHEGIETLLKLQAGIRQISGMLGLAQGTRVIEVPIDGRSSESIVNEVRTRLSVSN